MARGRLRVMLGAAPGVGKTFAMLEEARRLRESGKDVVVGIIDLSLGAAALGAGTYFLLANPVGKMDRDDQYTLGYALAGSGLPIAAFGVRSLVQQSLEETSWEAHRAAHGRGRSAGAPLTTPQFAVVPLQGGAGAFASFSF